MSKKAWQEKTAVVCGASAGLGRSLAVELARQGVSHLVLIARNLQPLEDLRKELLQLDSFALPPNIVLLTGDLVNSDDVHALRHSVREQVGKVDLLIQAVGQSDRGPVADLNAKALHNLLDVNVIASINAIQSFGLAMTRPGGTIVLIGSLASKLAPRFLGGYAIAKHALAALAQQSRLEFAELGVHIMLACPGPIVRKDAGTRYTQKASGHEHTKVPTSALQPGGGAKVKGLDPRQLSIDILQAAHRKRPELIRPRIARLLIVLCAISPSLGDRILRNRTA